MKSVNEILEYIKQMRDAAAFQEDVDILDEIKFFIETDITSRKIQAEKIVETTEPVQIELAGATLLSEEEVSTLLSTTDRARGFYWWTRTPFNAYYERFVSYGGIAGSDSCSVANSLSPACVIKNLEGSGLKVGDFFTVGKYRFKVISENLAWLYKQSIGEYPYKKTPDGKELCYETSDAKKVVDEWFEKEILNYEN